jgi:phosphoenolpyruvate---glycerone phosphotransferase subunit DhaK
LGHLKKLINRPDDSVAEMIDGMALAYPKLVRKVPGWNTLLRTDAPIPGKVALISGGGSGHEPAHAGYVGRGMLTAACAGEVFTSPSAVQVLEAIKQVGTKSGVLMIVKNFAGDVMNFRTAAQMAQGIPVEWVVVNDDVAIETPENRRGIAGTVFVHKCAGAMAEEGGSLPEVKTVAQKVIQNVRSMSCALSSCTVPSVGKPTFELGPDEMEFGIGIHGERGTKKDLVMTADEVATILTEKCLSELGLRSEDEVAVLVQGNGGTPTMERFIVYRGVHRLLAERGIKVKVAWVGEYMTTLEMAGASVSILKLDDELTRLLGAPCDTIAIKQP